MRLIDLHKEWVKTGKLPDDGLCYCMPLSYAELFELVLPDRRELNKHQKDGFQRSWWGRHINDGYSYRIYNPFRQTIVLLICAINNEL